MKNAVCLGAGISGLSAAWQISLLKQYKVSLFELNNRVGGLCGANDFAGLKLDYGPHKIYSVIPEIMAAFKEIGGDGLKELTKSQKIVLRSKFLDYPINIGQVVSLFSSIEIIELGFSVMQTLIGAPFAKAPLSYEDYCLKIFGRKIYNIVFRPLAEKTWGDPSMLSAEIAKRRIPSKDMYDLLLRVLKIKKESKLTNAEFILYPYRGFYDLCERLASKIEKLGAIISLGERPVKLIIKDKRVETVVFNSGKEEKCDLLVSSIPLNELMRLLFGGEDIFKEKGFFEMRNSIIVYLLVNKPKVLNAQWIFCADRDLIFSRISEQKLSSDYGFPKDKTVVCCDFTCANRNPAWTASDKDIVRECVNGLKKLGLIEEKDVSDIRVVRIPDFYPCYTIGFEEKREALFNKINSIENVICTGRMGLIDYCNIDHCLEMAFYIGQSLGTGAKAPFINRGLLEKTRSFRIVD